MLKQITKNIACRSAALSGLLSSRRLWRSSESYLRSCGWFKSVQLSLAVDCDGKPIPWVTYSFLRFIEPRLDSSMTLFEFGSGHSTAFWSLRVGQVVSCEHDEKWYEKMKGELSSNVDYRLRSREDRAYSQCVREDDAVYDVVVIDGRDRVECLEASLSHMSQSGVIIWDNSERSRYEPAFQRLRESGYRRLEFYGMGPITEKGWETSVFYREGNCLGI